MKRVIIVLLLASSLSLSAQEGLVLHRVHVAPVEAENTDGVPLFFRDAGTTLFALINRDQPLITAPAEEANTILHTLIRPAEGGSELVFSLQLEGEEPVVSTAVIPEEGKNFAYSDFLRLSAGKFGPLLGKVPPEVRIRELAADKETEKILDEMLFSQSLLTRFEGSLWIGVASKNTGGENSSGQQIYLHFPKHYFGEVAWYPAPNHGVSATLFIESSDFMHPVYEQTEELYILPGIGYSYRTLGRLSGGFFAGYNLGGIRMKAREDITSESWTSLQSGESAWYLFSFFVMKPFVSYAVNSSWSVKTSFAIYFDIVSAFGADMNGLYFPGSDGEVEIQFLNIGVSCRW